ncbi:hypothetical protein L210DRAFT_3590861 [Boletus edulis BED1]|uniref:Uncharacterized protein n=1 Tax=Boletus edulis BED1 TaxID=1328754 RepID=A0AAD4B9M5_BOLED|nr:hypothetical protein L210DRAFT_3590861 [Boletus edulis BED1]
MFAINTDVGASTSSTATPSPTSSICASPVEQSTLAARHIRVKRSLSQLSTKQFPYPSVMVAVPSDLELSEPSFGDQKNSPPRIGIRIPGCKAPYELEMEREDAEERRRRMNPIVRDGDFQYRFRQDRNPSASLCRSPCRLSTF